jgi:hypothetical protein
MPSRPRVSRVPRTRAFFFAIRSFPRTSTETMKPWSSRPSPSPCSSAIFHFRSVILLFHRPFRYKRTKPFYLYELSHFCYFCSVIFVIFLQWLSHFVIMSTILLLGTQPFFGRVLRSAIFIQWLFLSSWSVILLHHCYSAQPFFATVINHFRELRHFFVATVNSAILSVVLTHFSILLSHFVFCYSELSHFYDPVNHFPLLWWTQSFC